MLAKYKMCWLIIRVIQYFTNAVNNFIEKQNEQEKIEWKFHQYEMFCTRQIEREKGRDRGRGWEWDMCINSNSYWNIVKCLNVLVAIHAWIGCQWMMNPGIGYYDWPCKLLGQSSDAKNDITLMIRMTIIILLILTMMNL